MPISIEGIYAAIAAGFIGAFTVWFIGYMRTERAHRAEAMRRRVEWRRQIAELAKRDREREGEQK